MPKFPPILSNKFHHKPLPLGIWALGFVSMFMDISSELIHSLLPVFMSSILGASMTTIGTIEGIAEATASITKIFSGTISDYLKKRKILAVIGYGLGAFTKPIFPLATNIWWVFSARFFDRIGKGIRGAPRDALIADITPIELRGAAYGLRQALDTVGAVLGPLLAIALMFALANDIRKVLWIAVIPAFLAVVVLIFGVSEPKENKASINKKNGFILSGAKQLPANFWFIVFIGAVFSLARFSEAFMVLRAQNLGLSLSLIPLVFIVMNIVYSIVAYPAGVISDKINFRFLLITGLLFLFGADILFAKANSILIVFIGTAFWGSHLGLTQGLLAKLVADNAPAELRGTAFGIFNLINGIGLLLASVMAGVLWAKLGPAATFYTGAIFAGLSVIGLLGSLTIRKSVIP